MKFYKKWSVLGTALLIMLLFALPAFAQWQSTPVQSVTFRETVPQNAIVVDGDNNYVYVAAHDGHRLVVYRWNITTGSEQLDAVWLIDGNLVSGSAGAYPSMALYDDSVSGYKYVLLSYVSGNELKAALFDPKDEKWYVHTVPCASLVNPKYTSIAVGHATSAFTNGATVAAIAVGGESGVWVATVNMEEVAGSATEAAFKSNLNWEVSQVTNYEATGVDVFLVDEGADLGKWNGLIYVSYIAKRYGEADSGLYLAVSKDGKNWSGDNGCIALVDADPNVVVDACTVGADTSLWVGLAGSNPGTAAIGIAYVTRGGNLLFTSFATSTNWDIVAELPYVAQSEFTKNVVVSGDASPCNIDLAVSGLASEATVAIAYFDIRTTPDTVGGASVRYATSANFGSAINFLYQQVNRSGDSAITLVYDGSADYYYSYATKDDLLKLATAAEDDLTSWTPSSGRTLANASLFGMGYSVAGSDPYHASFYDAVLRTLGYLEFDGDYNILNDATTLISNNPGWFSSAGDALAVDTNYLDAGWNTDIDVSSTGAPHIVFTSILDGSESDLDGATNPAQPATVSYVTTVTGGWTSAPDVVSNDYDIRDLDIELDTQDVVHVVWISADNNGVFYRQKMGTSWQTTKDVQNLTDAGNLNEGNLDMKDLVLSNGDEMLGLAVGYATSDCAYVEYAWKETNEQTFTRSFLVESFDGYDKMPEVALALYNDTATVVYSAPGGRGALSYETDVAQVSVVDGWKGTATQIDDGGCPLCERRDPFVVVDGTNVYVLYKYLDYLTTTTHYFRFGDITGTPEYVEVDGNRQASTPVFANASRMEALMSRTLFFYKGTTGIANAMTSEIPPAPEVTVTVDPTSLSFGEVNVGSVSDPQTVTVTVDNPTAADVVVDVTVPEGFSVTADPALPLTVPAGGSQVITLTVTFEPTDAVAYAGSIAVTVDGETKATVSVSGTGKSGGGGGGCSASGAGSLGLALLLVAPAILALRKK